MTVKEIINYFENAKEHYEISDEFVKSGYQQYKSRGYMQYAKKVGHIIDIQIAEPNQRWHFFESYILRSFADDTITLDNDFSLCYNKLLCPELLLWIAEAAGIDKTKVQLLANKAKNIIDSGEDGTARNKAGIEIRQEIPWEEIENCIKKQK